MTRKQNKTTQLQLRVSPREKAQLEDQAKRAGMSVAAWVLSRAITSAGEAFARIIDALVIADDASFALAELHDLLVGLTARAMEAEFAKPPRRALTPELANQVAAMIEVAAHQKGVAPPEWTQAIPPLTTPIFASSLQSLRLHLLMSAPPPFRRRNLFVDASIGERV